MVSYQIFLYRGALNNSWYLLSDFGFAREAPKDSKEMMIITAVGTDLW